MAADTGNQVNSNQISGGNISDKNEVIVCDCCEKVTLELKDVILEISSLREIMRVLQEEIMESAGPSNQLRIKRTKPMSPINSMQTQRTENGVTSHQTDEIRYQTQEGTPDSYP
jgi:hypothetical protein